MNPDYDASGYDHRPATTGADTQLRALLGVALNNAFASVEHGQTSDGAFRPSLQRACDAARQHGLRAEQFVLLLKHTWAEHWQTRVLNRQQAAFALERVVTVGIQEFYRRDNDESIKSDNGWRRHPHDEAEA